MTTRELAAAIERPELHKTILKGYRGPYSLGVTASPGQEGLGALMLRVGDDAPADIPREIAIDGEPIPVIIKRGFLSPTARMD